MGVSQSAGAIGQRIKGIIMALTERMIVDNITVLEDGQMAIRTARVIFDGSSEISRTFRRHVISPGSDVSAEDERVQAVASVVHTKDVISAYIKAAKRPSF